MPATEFGTSPLGEKKVVTLVRLAIRKHPSFWKMPRRLVTPYFSYFLVRYYKYSLKLCDKKELSPEQSLSFEQIFGHIFRSTYQILKIIDEQFDDDQKSKKRYVNLLRAQMSESEFIFFALSALTKDGQKSWARSIKLNFFEDRLQNLDWTKELAKSFAVNDASLKQAEKILKDE